MFIQIYYLSVHYYILINNVDRNHSHVSFLTSFLTVNHFSFCFVKNSIQFLSDRDLVTLKILTFKNALTRTR